MSVISIPHNGWMPRDHQDRLWDYLVRGGDRAIAIWHRRAGKDEVCLHFTAWSMMRRVGNFWHCLPEYAQARRAIWTAINPHTGLRRIDEAFPPELRETTQDQEMFIRLKNGSTWQCIGSDSYDRTVGSSPAGIVYSEYALANPSAWAYHRPMLQENGGWAIFITTPRGYNHAKSMYDHAVKTPGWFSEVLTAEQTGALSKTQLDEALAEYLDLYGDVGQAAFDQEYNCSFTAAIVGSFYSREMANVRSEGRVLQCEAIADRPVMTCWDLGVTDDTSIWMYQVQGAQVVLLDHLSASGVGVEWYRDELNKRFSERGWLKGDDYVPHDAKIKEWGSGRTRVETMRTLGLNPLLVPLATVDDGINAVRRMLPLCVFHPRCETGLNALEQYRREWDDEKKCFKNKPLHDWTSHAADAMRYLAMSYKATPRRVVAAPALQGWHIPPPGEARRGGIRL